MVFVGDLECMFLSIESVSSAIHIRSGQRLNSPWRTRCAAAHSLHFLADLLIDLKVFGHAAVHANALALVELALRVPCANALVVA